MSPGELDALLKVLEERGVSDFECDAFSVRFYPAIPVEVTVPRTQEPVIPKSVWHDKNLWPDGKPPAFPAKDK